MRHCLIVVTAAAFSLAGSAATQPRPEIPRTWSAEGVSTFELPLASPEHSPVHVSADYYYRLPVRPVYRSYPIYHPDREPAGYQQWLREQEPEEVFDDGSLVTDSQWIEAGALVFAAPIAYDAPLIDSRHVRDRRWYADRLREDRMLILDERHQIT